MRQRNMGITMLETEGNYYKWQKWSPQGVLSCGWEWILQCMMGPDDHGGYCILLQSQMKLQSEKRLSNQFLPMWNSSCPLEDRLQKFLTWVKQTVIYFNTRYTHFTISDVRVCWYIELTAVPVSVVYCCHILFLLVNTTNSCHLLLLTHTVHNFRTGSVCCHILVSQVTLH